MNYIEIVNSFNVVGSRWDLNQQICNLWGDSWTIIASVNVDAYFFDPQTNFVIGKAEIKQCICFIYNTVDRT